MPTTPLARAAAVLVLVVLALTGTSTTAARAADPALIDPDAAVRLTITKYLGAPTGQPNDGRDLGGSGPALPTLQGVEFDVYRVYTDSTTTAPVDLATNAGWEAASTITGRTLTVAEVGAGNVTVAGTTYYLGDPASVTTAASGVATFDRADGVGLYVVAESVEAGDAITRSDRSGAGAAVPGNEVTPIAPFFVTLPMTDPATRERWLYDVHVYPKNQQDTVRKTVADRGVVSTQPATSYGAAGVHELTYTLTSSITDAAAPLGSYVLYDDLHESVTLRGVGLELSGGTALAPATDYTTHTSPAWGAAATPYTGGDVAGGPVVTVVLTADGRAKLEASRGEDVVTTIRVAAGARDADGKIENRASFVPNDGWWAENGAPAGPGVVPNDPGATFPAAEVGIRSGTVTTAFGDLVVDKYEPRAGTKLAGAVFAVYRDAPGGAACAPDELVDADLIGTTVPTDAAGATRFSGLQTSDFSDGATAGAPTTYCLVERTAPSGHELDAQPRAFTIAYRSDGTLAETPVAVPNEESNLGNELPLTGGPGVALLSVLGALLILGGLGYYVVTARRRR